MLSIYSDYSSPKCKSKKDITLDKINRKAITKQKRKTLQTKKKSEQSLKQAYQNQQILKQQTYSISQIKNIGQQISSIQCNQRPLGRLFIDEFTMNYMIQERKITPEFVECKLQPTNFFDDENELPKIIGFYSHELLQFQNSFPVQTQQLNERKKFENSLCSPYERISISSQNSKLIKISKKWNYDFLRMMGINQQIIDDYISNNNLLPKCWDQCKIFSINGESYFTTNIINYQGEKFVSNVQIKRFIEYNQNASIREQVIYAIFQCERQFLSVQKIQANFQHYFNLQQIPPDCYFSIHKSKIVKRCSFRKKAN
ncbi:unnamed protein product [Paramecium sonneborni]|uniref:Uncharacterized protein n=1 Tax=Paramecium sonneborni TaxID=65129 RepID=A0A8S1KFQ0_9CILI|nr:unnamed protein product [Paramecium sonneborni]